MPCKSIRCSAATWHEAWRLAALNATNVNGSRNGGSGTYLNPFERSTKVWHLVVTLLLLLLLLLLLAVEELRRVLNRLHNQHFIRRVARRLIKGQNAPTNTTSINNQNKK